MNKKLLSIATTASLLIASLVPMSASVLSTATMSLSGNANTTGNFAVTVYENSGTDTVTGANVALDFTGAVSNVNYDYSVGPFIATTPSGAHNAYGTVSGQQPVALVSFTVNSPSTVTASVGASSYLKHVEGTTIQNFVISGGSADFTYTAPVVATTTTTSTSAPKTAVNTTNSSVQGDSTTANAPAPTTTKATSNNDKPAKSDETTKATDDKSSWHDAAITTSTAILLLILAGGLYWVLRRRTPVVAPVAYKAGKKTAVATSTKKSTSKAKTTKSTAKAKTVKK